MPLVRAGVDPQEPPMRSAASDAPPQMGRPTAIAAVPGMPRPTSPSLLRGDRLMVVGRDDHSFGHRWSGGVVGATVARVLRFSSGRLVRGRGSQST